MIMHLQYQIKGRAYPWGPTPLAAYQVNRRLPGKATMGARTTPSSAPRLAPRPALPGMTDF